MKKVQLNEIKVKDIFTADPKGKFKVYDPEDILDPKEIRWEDLPEGADYYPLNQVKGTLPPNHTHAFNFGGKGTLCNKHRKLGKWGFTVLRMTISVISQEQREELCFVAKPRSPVLCAVMNEKPE